jgi:raffinose/stachyose/melibiose transport system permease protein
MVLKSKSYFSLFLFPALFLVAVFLVYPLFRTLAYSFTAWRNFSPKQTFIGVGNYVQLLSDPVIRGSLRNTFIMMIFVFVFQIGVSLILAILVDSTKLLFKFFRTVYFFPILISATAIGLMFKLIYTYEYGLLNYVITLFGGEKKVWVTARTAIYLVTIPTMWQYVGFYFIIFMAGISKIPTEIYESADLDGIGAFRKAVSITIPLMRDVITSSVILVIAGCFKVFDMVYVITEGGPLNSSELLSTYMYNMAFRKYNGGYASAVAIVMILLGTGLTVILRKVLEPRDGD